MNDLQNIDLTILDHTPQGTCVVDEELTVLFWNKQIVDYTSISKDTINGKKLYDFFPEFLSPKYKLRIESGFQDMIPIVFSSFLHHDLFAIANNQSEYFFKITITFLEQEQKKLAIITLENLTELHLRINDYNSARNKLKDSLKDHKKIEYELRQSNKKFEDLASNIPGVIYTWHEEKNGNRGFTYLSPRAKDIFGLDINEIMNDYTKIPIHPDDVEKWDQSIQKAKEDLSDWKFEGRFIDANNNSMWWFAQAKLVSYDEGNYIFDGIIFDTTQRKAAELSLEQSEKRFRDIAQAAGEYIWEVDANGNYTFITDRIEQVLGFSQEEILGNSPFDYLHPNDKNNVEKYFFNKLKNKEPFKNLEHRSVTKDFKVVWQLVNGIPIIENNEVVGYRGTALNITDQKTILDNLAINEERLSLSLHSSKQGLLDWDLETNEVYYNKQWADVMGYDIEEIEQDLDVWFKSIHPDDFQKLRDELDSNVLSNRNKTLDFNYRAFKKNEEWIWVNVKGNVVARDDDDNPLRLIAVMRDITEAKIAEEMLLRREQEFKALIENSPNIITRIDKSLRFIYVNPAVIEEIGIDMYQMIGKMPNEVLSFIDDVDSWIPKLRSIFQNKESLEIRSSKLIGEEKKYFLTQLVPEFDKDGNVETILTITRNITNIQKAENEILKINNYNSILNDISASLINAPVSNIDNYINFAVKSIANESNSDNICLYHFTPERFILQNNIEWNRTGGPLHVDFQGLLSEDLPWWLKVLSDREMLKFNIDDDIPDYSIFEKEIIEKTNFSSYLLIPMIVSDQLYGFIFLASSNKKNYDDENLIAFLKMANEIITGSLARKEFDNTLLNAKNSAETANKAKSVFLANISHEIRTPMNAIIGFSEILSDQIIEQKQQEYLQGILSSGRSLLGLINDILDLSKIESDKMTVQYYPVKINNLFVDIENIFSLKAKEKGLALHFDIEHNCCRQILADEVRLKQILMNLIGNAIKFTHNGYVKVVAKATNIRNNKCDLVIAVEDTGIGIPDKEHEKIFEQFRQQDEHNTRLYGGTGLGLTITQKLVNLMNGNLELTSEVGKGSKFTVNIPELEIIDDVDDDVEEIDIDNINFESASILLADDNELNIALIKEYIKDQDVNLFIVSNGDLLIEEAKRILPDVVIFNTKLPLISGFEAIELLKAHKETSNIKYIALSTYLDDISIKSEQKVDGILIKPINKSILVNTLMKLIKYKIYDKIYDYSNNANTEDNINYDIQFTDELKMEMKVSIIAKWKEVRSNHIISEIGEFANELCSLGEKYNERDIVNYAKLLREKVDSFNIEKMLKIMEKFDVFLQNNQLDK